MVHTQTNTPLRKAGLSHMPVSSVELFFDLVYVFAITQVSHHLLHHLTFDGAVETLILFVAVWLGWQYTCWFTNWFDPERPSIRLIIFAIMFVALIMAAAIPDAFGERALVFAMAFVAIQVGRTLLEVIIVGSHPLRMSFVRVLAWLLVSACFWIAGALQQDGLRAWFWAIAVTIEYASPMIGYAFPGLGRSRTADWTINGGHLAERCQLFVMIALGETIVVLGTALSGTANRTPETYLAFFVAFLGVLAAWAIYFGVGSRAGAAVIENSDNPGRVGAYFHYVHVVLIAGIIVMAVGNGLVLGDPNAQPSLPFLMAQIAGPGIYLLGAGLFKTIAYRRFPASHFVGLIALSILAVFSSRIDRLTSSAVVTAVMMLVVVLEQFQLKRFFTRPT